MAMIWLHVKLTAPVYHEQTWQRRIDDILQCISFIGFYTILFTFQWCYIPIRVIYESVLSEVMFWHQTNGKPWQKPVGLNVTDITRVQCVRSLSSSNLVIGSDSLISCTNQNMSGPSEGLYGCIDLYFNYLWNEIFGILYSETELGDILSINI